MVCVALQCDANPERTRSACLKGRKGARFVRRRATWKWRGSSRNTTAVSTSTGSLGGRPPLQDDAKRKTARQLAVSMRVIMHTQRYAYNMI